MQNILSLVRLLLGSEAWETLLASNAIFVMPEFPSPVYDAL